MTILRFLRVYFQRITDKNGFDDIVLKFLYPPSHWMYLQSSGKSLFCIAFLPSGTHPTKKFSEDNCRSNNDHDEFYRTAGISCEQVWIQHSPPESGAPDLEVVSLETNDISNT